MLNFLLSSASLEYPAAHPTVVPKLAWQFRVVYLSQFAGKSHQDVGLNQENVKDYAELMTNATESPHFLIVW